MTSGMSPTVVIAVDKFKGSLTAAEVSSRVAEGFSSAIPDAVVRTFPLADGGEGTVDAMVVGGYQRVPCETIASDGSPVTAHLAVRGIRAVVEAAQANGLTQVPDSERHVLKLTTVGVGRLVKACLDRGAREIVLALGGSGTNDGGAGLLVALGACLLGEGGRRLPPTPAGILSATSIDLEGLDRRIQRCDVVIASDVTSPLTGSTGASRMFASQKGATPEECDRLEEAMVKFAAMLTQATGRSLVHEPGLGAAGGTAFALAHLVDARVVSGAAAVVEALHIAAAIGEADMVITGEGSLDRQTLLGKGPAEIARVATEVPTPVVAVVGRNLLTEQEAISCGFERVIALSELASSPAESMARAGELAVEAGRVAARELSLFGINKRCCLWTITPSTLSM